MDILNTIFSKPEYKIPIEFNTDNFKEEVRKLLSSYIRELEAIGAPEYVIKYVKSFRRSCVFSLSNYLKGIHSNAFENFERALDALHISDSRLLSTALGSDILFRGRENKDTKDYSDDQMYHIPLNQRGIISTQRYSFPGLPCLYAGASVYTCWVEMNRPSFERFQVATIKPSDEACKIHLYDLSNIPQRIEDLKKYKWFDEEEYLLYWPLLAICSVMVKHENDPFKPEYIFPQFLLEHILKKNKDNEIVGIKYASIKASSICPKQFEEDWHTYVNYVFPSRSDNMQGIRCDVLNERFPIINNRSGRELQVLTRILEIDNAKTKIYNLDDEPTKEEKIISYLQRRHIFTRDGKKYSYALSVFGMTEMAMLRDGFDDIDEGMMMLEDISSEEIDTLFDNLS